MLIHLLTHTGIAVAGCAVVAAIVWGLVRLERGLDEESARAQERERRDRTSAR